MVNDMNREQEEPDLKDLTATQLHVKFMDALRDRDREAAVDVIHELRYKIWAELGELPRDPRPNPAEQTEIRRLSAERRRKRMGSV